MLKRKAETEKTAPIVPRTSAIDEYEKKLADRAAEEEDARKRRREEKEKTLLAQQERDDQDDSIDTQEVDPDFAALMGFQGFGSKR